MNDVRHDAPTPVQFCEGDCDRTFAFLSLGVRGYYGPGVVRGVAGRLSRSLTAVVQRQTCAFDVRATCDVQGRLSLYNDGDFGVCA